MKQDFSKVSILFIVNLYSISKTSSHVLQRRNAEAIRVTAPSPPISPDQFLPQLLFQNLLPNLGIPTQANPSVNHGIMIER
jgi:hypothetical protein